MTDSGLFPNPSKRLLKRHYLEINKSRTKRRG